MPTRFCRLLLRFYPRDYRRAHGDELTAFFFERHARVRAAGGRIAMARLFVRTLADAAVHGCAERWTQRFGGSDDLLPAERMRPMTGWRNDLLYALRALRARPGFAAVALLTLAIGIGANTAMFAIVDAVLLRPLPYEDPGRLVSITETNARIGGEGHSSTWADMRDWDALADSFVAVSGWAAVGNTMTDPGEPTTMAYGQAPRAFLELFGVEPQLGRFYTDAEQRERAQVIVLDHRAWMRHFGGDPAAVGRTLTLGDKVYDIIGVLPARFRFPLDWEGDEQLGWIPVQLPDQFLGRDTHIFRVIGRMAPGVTVARAQAELSEIAARIAAEHPESKAGHGVRVVSLHEELVGDVRRGLLLLEGAVALVLMLVCLNIGHLVLARGVERRREMAVRRALGAGRWRLLRQTLIESLVLAGLGGALGLLIDFWLLRAAVAMLPENLPRADQIGIDLRAVAFAAALSGLAALAFGLLPALRTMLPRASLTLRQGAGATAGAASSRLRGALVVAEVTVSVVVLVAAALLVKSFVGLATTDPEIDTDNVLVAPLRLPYQQYSEAEQQRAFFDALRVEVAALSGVESVGIVDTLAPSGTGMTSSIRVEGEAEPEDETDARIHVQRAVESGYFRTLRVELLAGRLFDGRDDAAAPRVALANETLARNFLGDDPIGRRVRVGGITEGEDDWLTVVGVVADVRTQGLKTEVAPLVYLPLSQHATSWAYLVARTSVEPEQLAGAVRDAIRDVGPTLPLHAIQYLDRRMAASIGQERFQATLIGMFAAIALLLTCIGVFGVLSYTVAQRTREMGLRMALGARAIDVHRLVLRRGMALVVAGMVLGLLGALAASRLLTSLLYGVAPTDPMVYAGVAGALVLTTLPACFLPARRATRVDPMEALRGDA